MRKTMIKIVKCKYLGPLKIIARKNRTSTLRKKMGALPKECVIFYWARQAARIHWALQTVIFEVMKTKKIGRTTPICIWMQAKCQLQASHFTANKLKKNTFQRNQIQEGCQLTKPPIFGVLNKQIEKQTPPKYWVQTTFNSGMQFLELLRKTPSNKGLRRRLVSSWTYLWALCIIYVTQVLERKVVVASNIPLLGLKKMPTLSLLF